MEPEEVSRLIEQGLPHARVQVTSDDNTHYAAVVVADLFSGKRMLARHRIVYECLGERIGREIHAMAIRAYTPDEWRDLELAGKV